MQAKGREGKREWTSPRRYDAKGRKKRGEFAGTNQSRKTMAEERRLHEPGH